jgi:CubicO group peptidase (beta-lactamase class C family)
MVSFILFGVFDSQSYKLLLHLGFEKPSELTANFVRLLFLGICLLHTSGLIGQSLEDSLESVFQTYQLMGMSVCVSANGTDSCFNYGLRDLDRDLPINDQTKYRIASISKTFTALGLVKLYSQGLFDLDDDVSPFLGFALRNPDYPGTPITFRMLLSHTSSLQDGSGYSVFLNATYNQQPVPAISELLLPSGTFYSPNCWRTEQPGSYFAYSNLNYGVIGTLIEAISGLRFDIYMRQEILLPLGIDGSFNIQDIPDINDIAALYRNIGGWQAQFDNYQGSYPTPPDLSGYVPGTNGLYFAPQGGLRASATEVQLLSRYLRDNGAGSALQIDPAALQQMKSVQWDYNGSNGDNYGGLFNRWGLGLHHANITQGDFICPEGAEGAFIGHPGEAYGLISDTYFYTDQELAFTILINGSWPGYQPGNTTSFYTVEEALFQEICGYYQTLKRQDSPNGAWSLWPNPVNGTFKVEGLANDTSLYKVNALDGRLLVSATLEAGFNEIDLDQLTPGIYLIVFEQGDRRQCFKIIKR